MRTAAYNLLRPLLLRPLPPLAALLVLALGLAAAAGAGLIRRHAEAGAVPVDWAQLIPPELAGRDPREGARGIVFHGGLSAADKKATQPGGPDATRAVVRRFDGARVRMDGYVVPLVMERTKVVIFLLVPYAGACIHVPPPPPNQIVYVVAKEGFDLPPDQFTPVRVTGVMDTEATTTEIADVGYRLSADRVVVDF
jgi:uncharacterized protein